MRSIDVRIAEEADLDFVSQDGYLAKSAIRRKIGDGDVIVAIMDSERVGYLRLEYLWSRLPYIALIRVAEAHRRSGVGRALLTYAEKIASAKGHDALYSSSQVDEPEPQEWHRRAGFKECGFIAGVNERGIGEVFFRKILNKSDPEV